MDKDLLYIAIEAVGWIVAVIMFLLWYRERKTAPEQAPSNPSKEGRKEVDQGIDELTGNITAARRSGEQVEKEEKPVADPRDNKIEILKHLSTTHRAQHDEEWSTGPRFYF